MQQHLPSIGSLKLSHTNDETHLSKVLGRTVDALFFHQKIIYLKIYIKTIIWKSYPENVYIKKLTIIKKKLEQKNDIKKIT